MRRDDGEGEETKTNTCAAFQHQQSWAVKFSSSCSLIGQLFRPYLIWTASSPGCFDCFRHLLSLSSSSADKEVSQGTS